MKLAPLAVILLAAGCSPPSNAQAPKQAPPTAEAPDPMAPRLAFPVACVVGQTCEVQNYVDHDPGPGAKDYRCGTETYEAHSGVDIRVPNLAAQRAGVNVLAAAAGTVARLRDGVADISVKAPGAASVGGQECGNGVVIDHGQGWETQYCHLAKGSLVVKQGEAVSAGQPIARIGLSGNTEYPHVHVTVRRSGAVVDPFGPGLAAGACDPRAVGQGLWTPAAAKAMAYKPGAVLNAGFAGGPVSMDSIEAGGVAPPTGEAGALVAYVRAINLQTGDVQRLMIKGPDGSVMVDTSPEPLDRAKAQYMMFAGKRKPAEGWRPGAYVATYEVRRGGTVVLKRVFEQIL